MGEANEVGTSEIENGYPRDLLQRFIAGNHFSTEFTDKTEDTEEIELNLGLSLGGCFGVDPTEKKRLVRSSSIAGLTNLYRDEDTSLIRTCSLPVATDDERRKRKELQSLRRLEAKRKRSEKQRNCRLLGKDRAFLEGSCEEDRQKQQQQFRVANGFSPSMSTAFKPPNWVSPGGRTSVGRRIDTNNEVSSVVSELPPLPSQASLGSQGSSSSGGSEIEGRPAAQGLTNCSEARSPMSVQSLPECSEQKPVIVPTSITTEKSGTFSGVKVENPSNRPPKVIENGSREMGMKMMEEMPGVSTTGNGPDGKRIEGFLYKYGKGEEVRIVCVCHGSFLSPAEFVKHAGGGDVAHPLRHITVNRSSSSF
ncbi:Ninja [Macleaya cordata]|uniref:Ninja-family protein n=1 Tax=Macleaya cordata TaxID=56857 RepID=A0A200PRI6_MACCD|nr:Ninja [Macleaya cordata]